MLIDMLPESGRRRIGGAVFDLYGATAKPLQRH